MDTSNTTAEPETVHHSGRSRGHHEPSHRLLDGSRNGSSELDPRLIWLAIRHCWPWATPIGLSLAAIATFAVYSTFVPQYRATHLLEANRDFVVFQGVLQESSNLLATESQLVHTDLVLDATLSDSEVLNALKRSPRVNSLSDAKDLMRRNLSVGNGGSTSLLTIAYKDASPVTAALVANKLTESYLAQRERRDDERVQNLESWLAPSIDLWKSEVQSHEERVRQLSKVSLGFDPSQRVEGLEHDLTILGALRRDLADLIVEESILEARIAMSEADPRTVTEDDLDEIEFPEPTTAEIEQFVSSDGEVRRQASLLADRDSKIRALEDQGLKNLRQDYYRQLQEQAAEYRAALDRAKESARQRAPEILRRDWLEVAQRNRDQSLKQAAASAEASIESQKQSLAELQAKRAIIQGEYDTEKMRLEQQGGNSADLFFAQEDRAVASGILAKLNERLAAIRTERRRGSGVHTLAEAKPPTKPIEPYPLKHMVVAGGGAFAIPFLLGLLFEYRTQRISDVATIESRQLAPVVGEVAKVPAKVGRGKRHRVFEESIDTLRANLMLSKETRNVRTVAIASSMSGEGKSSVSSQLAISLAKASGKTVLLVDADLRSPDQHDIFGVDMGPGLAKVMSGEVDLKDAVDRSLGDLVHILPAGRMTMSPHRLLNASSLRRLLDDALNQYSYVVIDTAPVLSAGETLAVAAETDATLLCVMRDISRTDTVVRSSRRLEAAGANVVGTVFSGVPARQYAYRYGDYRYFTDQAT